MIKYLFVILTLLVPSILKAELPRPNQPRPNNFVSQAVYSSSFTNATIPAGSELQVSTRACLFHSIIITSAATVGPVVEVFNSRVASPNASRKVAQINSGLTGDYVFNVFMDSGIAINNQGSTPASMTIIYTER